MVTCSRLVRALLATATVAGTAVATLAGAGSSPAGATLPGTAMALQEFVNDGLNNRAWNAYNQTADSQGPNIDGRPSPIDYGTTVHVYARAANGDLTEFVNNGLNHRVWNSYDLTQITGGPTIAADPGATFYGPTVHVYATASDGDLIEFVNDGAGGRLWNSYDLTQISGGPPVVGDPTPSVNATTDRIFARDSTGDLIEYVNDGANGQLWNAYDLTQLADGVPIEGDPDPVVLGNTVHIYAPGTNGDLIEYVDDGLNGRTWNAYDLTASNHGPAVAGRPSPVVVNGMVEVFARGTDGSLVQYAANNQDGNLWNAYSATSPGAQVSGGPSIVGDPSAVTLNGSVYVFAQAAGGDLTEFTATTTGAFQNLDVTATAQGPAIGGDPGPVVFGTTIHVYAGGPPPATPPTGVGLYGLSPGAQTAQAIEDNWPIIGDTGALGTTSAPYTGLNLGADLSTGQAIAASGKRVTWLSFWTVSGPVSSNSDGSACYTAACYYSAAFGAGQYVAQTIDSYGAQGLSLKPDWVILDPEGFPDNHSGLDSGPGSSDANWSSFLTGWANGLTSVDPSLHAAFYADQYEYDTFDLGAIQLPAFVALAFPGPTDILTGPTTNVAGFIAFGATCPAGNEEQTLLGSPWSGSYNTLQFEGGQYCGP